MSAPPCPWRRVALLGVVALAGALALAGCSNSPESTSPGYSSDDRAAAPAAAPEGAGAAGGEVATDAQKATDGQKPVDSAPVQERSLLYTGTITVKVDAVSAAADRAIALAVGIGGFVAGDNRTIDADRSQATLILRVPADRFSSTLDGLAKLGTEETRQVASQDVTDTLVDLEVRVATQEASVNRVRELLVRAQTIGEIVSLEGELTRRQADLDSLKNRRAKLSGLVDLATITAVLHGPDATVLPAEPETGFLAGLKDGWKGFLASVKIVLTVAGWLLPWVVAIGLPLWLIIWLRRRTRRSRTAVAPTRLLAPATPTPASPASPASPPSPPSPPDGD